MQNETQLRLRNFIERAERLEADIDGLKQDLKSIFSEAKGEGFDPKTMKKVISLRKKNKTEREEEEALLHTYLHAVQAEFDFVAPALEDA